MGSYLMIDAPCIVVVVRDADQLVSRIAPASSRPNGGYDLLRHRSQAESWKAMRSQTWPTPASLQCRSSSA